jgi:lipopolysaccharide/colanic/teichoic acid biosynthesis glycosyltransferase
LTYQVRADYSGEDRAKILFLRLGARGFYARAAKRMVDIAVVLMVSLPVLLTIGVLAIVVAMDGKSPFYFQDRVGRHGRVFRMWKLRSMVENADKALEAYLDSNPEARREWDLHQKLRHDPRITNIGRIIRASSLDELPQLWNVLRGDMSIVGPRPMMCSQQAIYPGSEYYAMRPGITGLWQVSARNETSFGERAEFDRAYFRQLSLRTDLRIMFQTVSVVVKATGH